ncbi:MAG: VanW family protein [Anaerolineales bacterium]|nr:MAG: VanW family protein [Anaerolineales bacterium]
MSSTTFPQSYSPAPPRFVVRAAAAVAVAAGLLALGAFLFSAVFGLMYLGRVYPGVSVGGVDIGGLRRTEAIAYLSQQLTYPLSGQVTLTYGEQSWTYSPAQLGLLLDAEASAQAAYGFGRSWLPWENIAEKIQSLRGGAQLAPRLIFNGDQAQITLQNLASQFNRPTVEAQLTVNGLDVQVQPGQVGLTLDTERTGAFLAATLLDMQNVRVPLAVVEQPPRILDVSAQAEIARSILSQPLVIAPGGNYEDSPGPWTLEPEQLAGMLSIERVESAEGAHYQVGLQSDKLAAILLPLSADVAATPRNARFIFNDDTRELDLYKSAVIGRQLHVQSSIDHINAQLAQGAHQIDLQYTLTEPTVQDDAKAADLGLRELVVEATTYFYGSSPERIQNIQTAAERFHGLLVPPGAVFSMVDNIGDISLDSGFAEALIIFGGRTIQGVGGGVCQVSTTLFRAAFFGGFPIVERWAHAYRVSYYEYNAAVQRDPRLVGLDATVYAPVVDFKFQNDTDSWLLMETYVNPAARSITWKFYSTSDGRSVEWNTTGPRDILPALDDKYEENPEFATGQIKQVDYAAEGATVRVTRTVYRNGEVINEDVITTKYQPWAAVYQYGPGTPGMPPAPPSSGD